MIREVLAAFIDEGLAAGVVSKKSSCFVVVRVWHLDDTSDEDFMAGTVSKTSADALNIHEAGERNRMLQFFRDHVAVPFLPCRKAGLSPMSSPSGKHQVVFMHSQGLVP